MIKQSKKMMVIMGVLLLTLPQGVLANSTSQSETGSFSTNEWKFVEAKQEMGENEEISKKGSIEDRENIKLTDEQVKELEKITFDLIAKRKELIDKYVEYGVLSKENADKIKQHLDDHFTKMKEAQFLPRWDKHKKQGKVEKGQ